MKDIVAWLDAHEGGSAFVAGEPYTKALSGHPRGWTQAVEVAAGVGGSSSDTGFAGRLVVELARPEPIGWHAAVIAERLDGLSVVSLQPVGAAVRAGDAVIGASFGGGIVDVNSLDAAVSVGGWVELPLGPVHAGVVGEVDDPITGSARVTVSSASVSLRLGRDQAYWPRTHAGVGPVITGGVAHLDSDLGSANSWFALVGLELYGAD